MEQARDAQRAGKAEGDEAFRAGNYERAVELYTCTLQECGEHAPTLCNRSLAALKLGRPEEALQNAEAALQLLSAEPAAAAAPLLPKAHHRKAEALLGLGRLLDGLRAYRQGLAACGGCPELHAALRLAAEELPVPWLAKYWAAHVEAAQAPHPLSARDGRLIKPVPSAERLAPEDLQAHLEAALYPLQDEARDLMCEAWARQGGPSKADAAFFRAAAYLNAGLAAQALKDARFALVYGPQVEEEQQEGGSTLDSDAAAGGGASGRATAERRGPAWPAALALLSGAHEALADNVPAALAMQQAAEMDPEAEEYGAAMERLMRRIPDDCAAALRAGGAAGLAAHLAAAAEAARPEFLRQRPKYYYYYEWMKKRISAQFPGLPGPVMDKLLTLEANELDLVLQYPAATRLTVKRLLDVWHEGGAAQLEGYAMPLLSWEEYQACSQGDGANLALPAVAGESQRLLEGRGQAGGKGGCGAGAAPKDAGAGGDSDAASEAGGVDVDELCQLD